MQLVKCSSACSPYALRPLVQVKKPWRSLLKKDYRPELVISFFVPFLQQLTGAQRLPALLHH